MKENKENKENKEFIFKNENCDNKKFTTFYPATLKFISGNKFLSLIQKEGHKNKLYKSIIKSIKESGNISVLVYDIHEEKFLIDVYYNFIELIEAIISSSLYLNNKFIIPYIEVSNIISNDYNISSILLVSSSLEFYDNFNINVDFNKFISENSETISINDIFYRDTLISISLKNNIISVLPLNVDITNNPINDSPINDNKEDEISFNEVISDSKEDEILCDEIPFNDVINAFSEDEKKNMIFDKEVVDMLSCLGIEYAELFI